MKRLIKIRSVSFKFTLLIVIFLTVIFSTGYILISSTVSSVFDQNITKEATSFSQLATKPLLNVYNIYYDSGFLKFKELTFSVLALTDAVKRVQVVSVNGDIEYDSQKIRSRIEAEEVKKRVDAKTLFSIRRLKPSYLYSGGNQQELSEIIYPYIDEFSRHQYSVRYFVSYKVVQSAINTLHRRAALLVIVFMFATFATTYLITRSIFLNPLQKLLAGIVEIKKGNYGHRIHLETGDELQMLAKTFNKMSLAVEKSINRLKELDEMKNEFIAITSHSLRTPITVISGLVEFLKEGKTSPSVLGETVLGIEDNLAKLKSLTEDLLFITSFEELGLKPMEEVVDVKKVVQNIFETLGASARHRRVKLALHTSTVALDANMAKKHLCHALSNLIENAIRFNKEGGLVDVFIDQEGSQKLLISIKDTGIGIKEEEVSRLYQKFHRGTGYLEYNFEGEGLGLYIVKSIVEAYGGKVWVKSQEGKGSTFFLTLPAKPSVSSRDS